MSNQHYTTSFSVNQSPQEVFDAINDVRGWWSESTLGDTDKLGAVAYYHYGKAHRCTFRITELVPGRRVSWRILHNDFSFTRDKSEWNDTEVVFDIARKGDKTEVRFTHVGLVPAFECYDVCASSWGRYINGSLHKLITMGKGQPNRQKAVRIRSTNSRGRSNVSRYPVRHR